MSLERSVLRFQGVEDQARATRDVDSPLFASANKYSDAARIWIRKAMAPGGVTGIVMAFVLIIVTDSLLLVMRSIQELPPVALTFLIPIIFAAIRWGALSAATTAIGGAVTLTYF